MLEGQEPKSLWCVDLCGCAWNDRVPLPHPVISVSRSVAPPWPAVHKFSAPMLRFQCADVKSIVCRLRLLFLSRDHCHRRCPTGARERHLPLLQHSLSTAAIKCVCVVCGESRASSQIDTPIAKWRDWFCMADCETVSAFGFVFLQVFLPQHQNTQVTKVPPR